MSIPGDFNNVPIKVVPIYFDPVLEHPPTGPAPTVEAAPTAAPRRGSGLGVTAFFAAVITAALTLSGVAIAASGGYSSGTMIAWVAIGFSILAVLAGLIALVLGRGRAWGIAAVIVGLLANPWLLTNLLSLVTAA